MSGNSLHGEEPSKLFDRRKQAKLQQIQNTSRINQDKLNNVRRKTNFHFMEKQRTNMEGKINEPDKKQ